MFKKIKSILIVLLLCSFMYVAPMPRVYASVDVFSDNFNIVAESTPKWSRCGLAQIYSTALKVEGNASVLVVQADNIPGSSAPIYHTLTGINTSEGVYNITGWAFSAGDHALIGIDIGAVNLCDFIFSTLIGRRLSISATNITSKRGGISNLPLETGTWFQVTQLIGRINATKDWVQALVNGTVLHNTTFSTISQLTIQLHDFHGGTVGASGSRYDILNVTQLGAAAALKVSIVGASIINLENCGDWVFAEEKFYNFSLIIGAASIAENIYLQLSDGVNNMTMLYNHTLDTQRLLDGNDVINFGLITWSNNTVLNQLTVYFPIFFRNTVLDLQDANITARATDTNGVDTGWVLVQQSAYNIYNVGGFSQTFTSGTAGRVSGGDTFELFAQNTSWAFSNQTFRKIQQITSQFGLRFTVGGIAADQGMQDNAHAGGGSWLDKGDWQLEIAMNYCDETADIMVKGFYVILQMEEGDIGVNDQWIAINATWYDRDDTSIRSEVFNAWIESSPQAQFRLWVDLWYNRINSSSVGGGRTTAYYTGMKNNGFLLWAGWSPDFRNASQSIAFIDLLDDSSSKITSPQLDLMSVSYNLSRPSNPVAVQDFRVTLRDFDIHEYKLRDNKKQMEGINTPIFVSTKVPDMPTTGFLAPLYAAILGIGTFVINGITGAAGIAWGWIGDQFPWFTGFIDAIGGSLGDLYVIFNQLFGGLIDLFAFAASQISLLATPFAMVGDVWAVLVDNTAIFFDVNPAEVSLLVVLMLGVIPIMDAFSRGDSSFLIRAAGMAWGVANTLMQFFIRLGQIVINIALEFWPF